MKISVVIPIYNAQNMIEKSYLRIKEQVEKVTNDYEVLFGNDGSQDRSLAILANLRNTRVKVYSRTANKGLGFTLRELFGMATGDIIIYLDIDLSFDITRLPDLVGALKDYDVVVASKYIGLNGIVPLKRQFISRLYCHITKALFGFNVKDIGSGFVIFRKKVLERIELSSEGFNIHLEYFTKIRKAGFKTKEIPVSYLHREGSFSILKHGYKIFLETFKFWINRQ